MLRNGTKSAIKHVDSVNQMALQSSLSTQNMVREARYIVVSAQEV